MGDITTMTWTPTTPASPPTDTLYAVTCDTHNTACTAVGGNSSVEANLTGSWQLAAPALGGTTLHGIAEVDFTHWIAVGQNGLLVLGYPMPGGN